MFFMPIIGTTLFLGLQEIKLFLEIIFCNLDFDYPENDMPDTFGDMSRVTNIGHNVAFGISIYI